MSRETLPSIAFIESSLKKQLDEEEEHLKKKVKFLRRVYDRTSAGAELELASTELSDVFLVGSIDKLFGG